MALQYDELAVHALNQVLSSDQLTDALRALEIDRGLHAKSLRDPVAVVDAFLPEDNRSPLVQIYDESGDMVDQKEGLYVCDCVVALSFTSTTNLQEGERFARRYMSAIRNVLRANPLLRHPTTSDAPQVVGCLIQSNDRVIFGDDSATRHHRGLSVQVRVHTP